MSTTAPADRALARTRQDRLSTRPPFWTQVAVVGIGLWLYDAINNLSPVRTTTALANARSLLALERRLRLDLELSSNRWLSAHPALGWLLGSWYDLAHFGVTLGLLAWVFVCHPAPYRFLRNALIGTNAIGFLLFWTWPLAPPRLVPGGGYVDVVKVTNVLGVNAAGTGSPHANELEAMPSLHIAYAAWCVLVVFSLRRDRVPRAGVLVYLVVTTYVVVATGNHYTLDVVAGAVTTVVAALGAALATRPTILVGHDLNR